MNYRWFWWAQLGLLSACAATKHDTSADLASCQAISTTARETASCLVANYHWDGREAVQESQKTEREDVAPSSLRRHGPYVFISRERMISTFSATKDAVATVSLIEAANGSDLNFRPSGIGLWIGRFPGDPFTATLTLTEATDLADGIDSVLAAYRSDVKHDSRISVTAGDVGVMTASANAKEPFFLHTGTSKFGDINAAGLKGLAAAIRHAVPAGR